MIEIAAGLVTNYLVKREVVNQDEKDVYKYGFEILFSTILGICIVLILGLTAGSLMTSLIFIAVFCSLRIKCGGYHADSYLSCNVVFTTVFLIVLMVEKFSEKVLVSPPILFMVYLLGFLVIYIYAPVENVNKPLDMEEKKKGRKESHILYALWSVIGLVLYTYNYSAIVALTATVMMVIILMLAGIAKERKFKYAEKGK